MKLRETGEKMYSTGLDIWSVKVIMPNLNYDIPQDFEGNETMSELISKSMSELERTRMQIIFRYLDTNKEINSSIAAKLLKVEIKTASRLLLTAEKLDILKSYEKRIKDESKIRRHNRGDGICRYGNRILL